jgi:hypothetical protein
VETDGYVFVGESGGAELGVSAVQGNSATTTVRLAWTDSRLDAERTQFTVKLGAEDLTSDVPRTDGTGNHTISAGNLSIVQIGNVPLAVAASLDQAKIVFVSDANPPAGEGSLEIVLFLNIPPGTYATTYATRLNVEMIVGGGGP